MKRAVYSLRFLLCFLMCITIGQEVELIKTSVGSTVALSLFSRRSLAPAGYTLREKPDETIFKWVKEVWKHEDGYTTLSSEYRAEKIGTTYLHFIIHSNTNPYLASKWFIVKVE